MKIRSFIFLDLETTSLPHLEGNTTKIIELCLMGLQTNHFLQDRFPRCINKLLLCFNPRKQFNNNISALSNKLLENFASFDFDTSEMIKSYLNMFPKPICLVAHNGNNFDYPILRKELIDCKNILGSDILCVDSLQLFRLIPKARQINPNVEEKRTSRGGLSFKLGDIFKRLTSKELVSAHCAEADTVMLMESALQVAKEFTELSNANAKNFYEIRALTPK